MTARSSWNEGNRAVIDRPYRKLADFLYGVRTCDVAMDEGSSQAMLVIPNTWKVPHRSRARPGWRLRAA